MSCFQRCAVIALLALWAVPSLAGAPRVLPEGQLPQDRRLEPLKDLEGYFPFAPPADREAWQRRAEQLRRQVLFAAGLWPMPEKTPLKPVIHGLTDRGDYTIEKVYFESLPGFFVTGNLYRPKNRPGKLPGVLCPHGHWTDGRFTQTDPKAVRQSFVDGAERFESGAISPLQARCVQLARMGCVVFHYDMIGYADSRQLSHRDGVRAEMNTPQRWGFFSPQAEARLQTIFGLQTYDSIRALDFLCELPDVDPSRLGVTGASGGGTQTFILGAADPRPAVIFPAVMVSTAMQGGCPCENACYLRVGTGNIELAGVFAPKPLGMSAANDWTKEIATKGLPELKQLYRMLGVEDLVMAKPLLQFGHNYNYVSRAVMYAWFNKHLKLGLEEPIVEENFPVLKPAELTVWDAQHPAPPGGPEVERSLLERITADSARQIEALAPKDEPSLQEYRRIVGGAIETMIGRALPAPGDLEAANPQPKDVATYRATTFVLQYPAQGEQLPAVELKPTAWNRRAVVWIDREGKQSLWTPAGELRPSVKTLLDRGFAVLSADLIGQGEFTADGRPLAKAPMVVCKFAKPEEGWGQYAGYTYGYNRALFAQRVADVLSLVSFARGKGLGAEQVDVVGLGGAGHWVAAARAIAGDAINRAAIDTAGFRFANLTATDDPDFLPGGAKYGDLPGILALSSPRPLWLAGEPGARQSVVAAAYQAVGQLDKLTLAQENDAEAAAVEWLSKEVK